MAEPDPGISKIDDKGSETVSSYAAYTNVSPVLSPSLGYGRPDARGPEVRCSQNL